MPAGGWNLQSHILLYERWYSSKILFRDESLSFFLKVNGLSILSSLSAL